jgi:hypothetical protein
MRMHEPRSTREAALDATRKPGTLRSADPDAFAPPPWTRRSYRVGVFVGDKENHLLPDEQSRARAWGETLVSAAPVRARTSKP